MKFRTLALALCGAGYGLGFPSASLAPLAWFTVAGLIVLSWDLKPGAAFRAGFVYGLAGFATALYWVDNSVRIYGHLPLPLSVATVLLLAAYLALYPAVFTAIFTHLYRSTRYPALILAPVLWVSLDLLRTYFLTGFPWASLGYTQFRWLPLIQISDLTGVYGVTFVVVAVNGLLADLILFRSRMKALPLFPVFPTIFGAVLMIFLVAGVFAYGSFRMKEEPGNETATVSVIQGNIDQSLKWEPSQQRFILNTYFGLTRGEEEEAPDLVIWPETAVPFVFDLDPRRTEMVRDFVRGQGIPVLLGATLVSGEDDDGGPRLANAALLLSPQGETAAQYRKIHLVPFGEYVPLGLPLARLVTAIGDFDRGKEFTVMRAGSIPFSTVICYEIIFPELVRKFVARGARLLTTITNDAWFGRTAAPYQHFSMAVFRAVENRVPVARAANTGVSGFIDDRGRILERSRIFREQALTRTLVLGSGTPSFYTRFGNVFGYLCVVAAILMIIFKGETKKWPTLK